MVAGITGIAIMLTVFFFHFRHQTSFYLEISLRLQNTQNYNATLESGPYRVIHHE